MFTKTQKKAADLVVELKKEVFELEAELAHKKELLNALLQLNKKAPMGARGKMRRPGRVGRPPAGRPALGRPRAKAPVQRKSKNRDAILAAADRMKKKEFTLAELKNEIHKKDPKFGGNYASGTILATLRNTKEIKKKKRGLYAYKKRK